MIDDGRAAWDSWEDRIHMKDRTKAYNAYYEAVSTGIGYTEPLEMTLVDPYTQEIIAEITYDLQPEYSAQGDGEICGFVGVFNVSGGTSRPSGVKSDGKSYRMSQP